LSAFAGTSLIFLVKVLIRDTSQNLEAAQETSTKQLNYITAQFVRRSSFADKFHFITIPLQNVSNIEQFPSHKNSIEEQFQYEPFPLQNLFHLG
jgi:hypothetical protein